jgi:hypothetical protein
MDPELLEPYGRLVRIVILGRVFEVPETNLLLRQMQFVAPDIGYGKYCWNAECRYCEVSYTRPGDDTEHTGLACRLRGFDGMRLTKLAPEVKYNMSEALARAARDEDASAAAPATRPPE